MINKEKVLKKYNINGLVYESERIVILDLEATCENPRPLDFTMETIEIGAIDNFGQEFSTFVKPKVHKQLTEFCKELTTITQEQVDGAESFPKAWSEFVEYFEGATLLSWGAYDKNQLIKDIRLNKLDVKNERLLDNHINMKELYKDLTGLKAGGMGKELRRQGLELQGTHHRAIDDVRNLMNIFNKITDDKYKRTVD